MSLKRSVRTIIRRMIVTLQTARLHTVERIRGFLDGSGEVDFRPLDRDEAYDYVRRTLVRLDYDALLEGSPVPAHDGRIDSLPTIRPEPNVDRRRRWHNLPESFGPVPGAPGVITRRPRRTAIATRNRRIASDPKAST